MMGIFPWKKKNSIEGQPVDGIVQGGEKTVLSLREKVWKFEISPRILIGYLQKNKTFVLFGILLLFIVGIVLFSNRGNASVVNFYPTKCLGGWEHVENITGSPNVKEGASVEEYTEKNSAILNKGVSEMYCGGFIGETPKDITASKFTVHFSWAVTDAIHEEKLPSIDTVIDSTTPVIQEEHTSVQEDSILPTEDVSSPMVPIESSPSDLESSVTQPVLPMEQTPTSFLFIPKVYAQEVGTEVLNKNNEEVKEVIPKDEIIPIPETNENQTNDKVDISNDEKKEEVVVSPTVDQGFLEALYSLDGTTWKHLGYVNKQNWQGLSFEINEPDLSWSAIPTIQIELKSVQTFDATPVVYLDSLWLSVSYEEIDKEVVGMSADAKKLYVTDTTATTPAFSMRIIDDIDQGQELLFFARPNTFIKFYLINDSTFGLTIPVGTDQVLLPTYNLSTGQFIAVNTNREDACDKNTLLECMSGDDFIGVVRITLASKLTPEELQPSQSKVSDIPPDATLEPVSTETFLPNIPSVLNVPSDTSSHDNQEKNSTTLDNKIDVVQ